MYKEGFSKLVFAVYSVLKLFILFYHPSSDCSFEETIYALFLDLSSKLKLEKLLS